MICEIFSAIGFGMDGLECFGICIAQGIKMENVSRRVEFWWGKGRWICVC